MKRSLFATLMDKLDIHIWEYYIRHREPFNHPHKKGEKYKIPYLYRVCKLTGKKQEICIWLAERLPAGKITNWKPVKSN